VNRAERVSVGSTTRPRAPRRPARAAPRSCAAPGRGAA
jgi:hypothetical protein